jgi:hypothetical protein
MKLLLTVALLSTLVAGCASTRPLPPILIWRESSGIPLKEVPVPLGFIATPYDAIGALLAMMKRVPGYEAYLFADATYYFFGFADKEKCFPEVPDEKTSRMDGRTGKWIQRKETPNQSLDPISKGSNTIL